MEFLTPKPATSDAASTQKYVDVADVRDGVIVLRNGSIRCILLASSINFDLKSTEEQDAIIAQYQGFLNSLDFPLQIVVHSRRFRIDPYLARLDDEERRQENELLRFQISEYRNFVQSLTEVSNIMSKYFYIVVPFAPSETERGGLFGKLEGIFSPKSGTAVSGETLETYRSQLFQRADQVSAALMGTGVRTSMLGTEEVIELLYNTYNPSVFTTTVIRDVDRMELSSSR
ncbi:MAG: hypothetical protein HGA38_00050 [Candidatus Moranbacteria bacterium]|nr:hypothetical protein [Candidatus Moranbacteria bacterium]NTW45933.1 hypothetical protein [Candidatus Moranbacteria bacterium]